MKTEEQKTKLGKEVINFLNLKPIKGTNPKKYPTEWGEKTALGLGSCINRIVNE